MNLKEEAAKRIIIAAHRGVSGGNIPCNTIAAYDAALAQGADMIEIDANRSADGTLFIFHPRMEPHHLHRDIDITQLTDIEIRKLRYVNYDRTETQFGLCSMEEVFARYKGRCFINVDKFWLYPKDISDLIQSYGMEDQIVVKTAPESSLFDLLEQYYPEIAYLPIIRRWGNTHEELKRRKINYVGAEILFSTEADELGAPDVVDRFHRDGKLVWANAIIYNYKRQLAGGHSDDISIVGDPDNGWGWLANRGYDIIQTDWTLALRLYLEQIGKRLKRQVN